MPYPKPTPRVLPDEGWRYGYIMATPVIDQQTIKKNTPDEQEVDILRVRCMTAVADESGNVETWAQADIFLYTELDKGGSNWRYMQFLEALGIPMVKVPTATGEEEALPDPDPDNYVGKPIKFEVFHETWEGRSGPITSAKISAFDSWDGKDPESGESVNTPDAVTEKPAEQQSAGGSDDDDNLPF